MSLSVYAGVPCGVCSVSFVDCFHGARSIVVLVWMTEPAFRHLVSALCACCSRRAFLFRAYMKIRGFPYSGRLRLNLLYRQASVFACLRRFGRVVHVFDSFGSSGEGRVLMMSRGFMAVAWIVDKAHVPSTARFQSSTGISGINH